MGDRENGSHFAKRVKLKNNQSHFAKWVTLIKLVAFGSMGHTGQIGSRLTKWVTFGKMGHTWQNGSRLKIMGHT